ncbi:MAG: sulfotransferase [Parasphingopyxis sp.]|nr:sulfotransferase [Sphingomonadales bacterium]
MRFEKMTFFLGLGPAKTGTTWLHDYLEKHPEFLSSKPKELHFFSALHHKRNSARFEQRVRDNMAKLAEDPERNSSPAKQAALAAFAERLEMAEHPARYIEAFRRRAKPEHKAFGELSPSYCALTEEGYRMVKAQHPRVRLMICLRDPIDRVDAVLRHMWNNGNRMPYDRFVDATLPTRLEYHNMFYDKLLDTIFGVFDESEVRVQFFEDMFTQPTLDTIADFIGIGRRPADFDLKLAHSPPAESMTRAHRERLSELLAPTYAAIRTRFGDRVPDSWAM